MDNMKLSKRNKALFTIKALSTKPLHCLDLDNIKLWPNIIQIKSYLSNSTTKISERIIYNLRKIMFDYNNK